MINRSHTNSIPPTYRRGVSPHRQPPQHPGSAYMSRSKISPVAGKTPQTTPQETKDMPTFRMRTTTTLMNSLRRMEEERTKKLVSVYSSSSTRPTTPRIKHRSSIHNTRRPSHTKKTDTNDKANTTHTATIRVQIPSHQILTTSAISPSIHDILLSVRDITRDACWIVFTPEHDYTVEIADASVQLTPDSNLPPGSRNNT